MEYYQILDSDGDQAGIVAIDVKQVSFASRGEHDQGADDIFKSLLQECEGDYDEESYPDVDYFVEWLDEMGIIAERIFTTDIRL